MIFKLHNWQYVEVNSFISFCHEVRDKTYFLSLSRRQFHNLVDLIKIIHYRSLDLRWFPLSCGIWLHYKKDSVKLCDNNTSIYFRFSPRSWKMFINDTFKEIQSFLRKDAVGSGERHATNVTYSKNQHRRIPSYIRQQALSRKTRDACHASLKQPQHSSISKRMHTNSRSCTSIRGGKDGGRIRSQIESDSTPYSEDETSDEEHGDQSEIEVPCSSPKCSIE